MRAVDKLQFLLDMGVHVGRRDDNMNFEQPGRYMVSEPYVTGHAQARSNGGVWCIVGDDLGALIDTAYEVWGKKQAA